MLDGARKLAQQLWTVFVVQESPPSISQRANIMSGMDDLCVAGGVEMMSYTATLSNPPITEQ